MLSPSMPPDPPDLLRRFRDSYVNLYLLWRRHPPAGTVVRTPAEEPVGEGDLPATLRNLLAHHRREHALGEVAFSKYMRVENGRPVKVVEDERGLPPDADFLSLSCTATLLTAGSVRVVTEVFVGPLPPGAVVRRERGLRALVVRLLRWLLRLVGG